MDDQNKKIRHGETKTRGHGDTESRRIHRVSLSPRLRVTASKFFDRVFKEADFVDKTYSELSKFGFNADNSIACVCVCRDEISQSLIEEVNKRWGYAFNLSSLGGMFFAGRTGLMAAMSHSPIIEGRERYVFYAMPHIAIDAEGRIGFCKRQGREGDSIACGALNAFQKELMTKEVSVSGNSVRDNKAKNTLTPTLIADTAFTDDIEMSLIRLRLSKEIPSDKAPDLLQLTKVTQKIIQKDIESALKITVDVTKSDYAIITGIQIHGADGDYVSPAECYAVVNGKKEELKL